MKRVCVFCGSSTGNRPEYAHAARAMGHALAERKLGLVYGGGGTGLMGLVADAALAAGGEVIGVIPRGLATKELAHPGLSDLRVVETMHDRKATMAELADVFVALPGGFGTLEEFCEVLTWSQLGIHRKACALLNTAGYFNPLLTLFAHAVAEGFVNAEHRGLVVDAAEPGALLEILAKWRAPNVKRWITPEKT